MNPTPIPEISLEPAGVPPLQLLGCLVARFPVLRSGHRLIRRRLPGGRAAGVSRWQRVLPLAAFAAFTPVGQAATLIQNFSAASNDRYANSPAFIGSGWDWSGVGRSSNQTWGTMITSSVFLSASHFHPESGNQMTFFPGNDPAATPVTRTVAGGQQIGSSDLWLGFLNATLPPTITAYDFARESISEAGFTLSGLFDVPAFVSGLTPTAGGHGAVSATRQTVGTNRLEGFIEDLTVGGTTGDGLVTLQNLAGDGVFGFTHTGFEAHPQGGDSGSPLMIVADGRLVLAGITWAIGTVDIDPSLAGVVERPAAAFTYVGSYEDGIVALAPELSAVPEPASALATAVFLASGLLPRQRGNRVCKSSEGR
jgi:hypothetical protein